MLMNMVAHNGRGAGGLVMLKESLLGELKSSKEFFDRSTRCLEEAHAGYRPTGDSLSTAEQIAHVGQSAEWFLDALKNDGQFNMDFESHQKEVRNTKTIADARAWVDRAYGGLADYVQNTSIEALSKPLPEGPIMGGAPSYAIISAVVEHTAHHRGALTVYSRLQGLTPSMPYMETQPA